MRRDQKFCIQALNTHFQIHFKVLPSRNMPKCWSKKKKIQETSKLFFFLQSITGCKEKIKIFFGNVNLHPIDCPHDDLSNYSDTNYSFLPHHLDLWNPSERKVVREIARNFLKHAAEMSNSNLIWNANSLMARNEAKIDTEVAFSWVLMFICKIKLNLN